MNFFHAVPPAYSKKNPKNDIVMKLIIKRFGFIFNKAKTKNQKNAWISRNDTQAFACLVRAKSTEQVSFRDRRKMLLLILRSRDFLHIKVAQLVLYFHLV